MRGYSSYYRKRNNIPDPPRRAPEDIAREALQEDPHEAISRYEQHRQWGPTAAPQPGRSRRSSDGAVAARRQLLADALLKR